MNRDLFYSIDQNKMKVFTYGNVSKILVDKYAKTTGTSLSDKQNGE